MSNPLRDWPMVLCGAALALGLSAGWVVGRLPLKETLADVRRTQAEADRARAAAGAAALSQAQARGDALTTALVSTQNELTKLKEDRHGALQKLTTGRACLNAATVRLLNGADTTAGPESVPQAPSGAAAAGDGFATDADVGQWAIDARAQHDDCRARLDALIDWHKPL